MDNQPKRWLERILEATIILAISAYLIRLAACYFMQALPVIIVIVVLAVAGVIGYRIWKYKRDSKW